MPKILLLESEAALRLRCSPSTVKRLRLAGKLAYVPGRPVKIEAADIDAYVESMKTRAATTDKTVAVRSEIIERARQDASKRRMARSLR